jgi:hypothetical protein
VTVSLANKSARVARALMVRESIYNHRLARAAAIVVIAHAAAFIGIFSLSQ